MSYVIDCMLKEVIRQLSSHYKDLVECTMGLIMLLNSTLDLQRTASLIGSISRSPLHLRDF